MNFSAASSLGVSVEEAASDAPALSITPSLDSGTWVTVITSVSPGSGVVGSNKPKLVPGESSATVSDLLSAIGGSSTAVMEILTAPVLSSFPVPSLNR